MDGKMINTIKSWKVNTATTEDDDDDDDDDDYVYYRIQ